MPVDNVILLSGLLSADYDLTKALQRVRGKLYSFSSEKDAVLQFLLPLGGTADRAAGTNATIGLNGVRTLIFPQVKGCRSLERYRAGWLAFVGNVENACPLGRWAADRR